MIKMFLFFFLLEILQKFNDLVNSDDCIGKITSKSIRLQQFFYRKKIKDLKLIKNRFYSSEKMINSGELLTRSSERLFINCAVLL